jgi:hypothetical protein
MSMIGRFLRIFLIISLFPVSTPDLGFLCKACWKAGEDQVYLGSLIRFFRNIAGKNLADETKIHTTDICASRISVISTKISGAFFGSHTHYQNIQINLQENLQKAAVVSLFASSLRSSVPERLWSRYQRMAADKDILHKSHNTTYLGSSINYTPARHPFIVTRVLQLQVFIPCFLSPQVSQPMFSIRPLVVELPEVKPSLLWKEG